MDTLSNLGGISHGTIITVIVIFFVGNMFLKAVRRMISKCIVFVLCVSMAGGNVGFSKYFKPQKLNVYQTQEFALMDNESRQEFQKKFSVMKKDDEIYVLEKLKDGLLADIQQIVINQMKTKGNNGK